MSTSAAASTGPTSCSGYSRTSPSSGSAASSCRQHVRVAAEAALPVVLASIRKDGRALLTAESAGIAALSPVQILVAVYLTGVLLPCLVTTIAVAREVSAAS